MDKEYLGHCDHIGCHNTAVEVKDGRFWCALHVPPIEDEFTLGPCGCTDYHMADCPLRTASADFESNWVNNVYNDEEWIYDGQ